jgi:hypothetical protein
VPVTCDRQHEQETLSYVVEEGKVTSSVTSVLTSDVGIAFDVIRNMLLCDEGPSDVGIEPDSDIDDGDKSNKSSKVTDVLTLYAIDLGTPSLVVDGKIDDIASSNDSKTGVTSSKNEKDLKEDVERTS